MTSHVELTKFTKTGGPLTKRISLAPDGTVMSDGSACVMARGTAERVTITNIDELAVLIGSLQSSQAIALGALRSDLPDQVEVVTKRKSNGGANVIARTGANIVYRGPAFALLDFDTKGISPAVAAELDRQGGFWTALKTVLPVLGAAAHVARRSTSAGLFRADTGQTLPGSNGVHVYVEAKDGADIERFLKTLHERCWLHGLGWMMVGAAGVLLERSIVDRMVGGAERLVFEGGPILTPPLQQNQDSRRPIAVSGKMLDTVAACPPLSIVERARLDEYRTRERQRLAPEAAVVRAAFIAVQTKHLMERTGKSEQAARRIIERQCEGVLRPDIELVFDDPHLAGCTVGDVLADPERFIRETLADPLEGISYGRCKAMVMPGGDGTPWIHSYAHGRTFYTLKLDADAVRKALEATTTAEVVPTLAKLAVEADLDAVELEALRQQAKKLSGAGLKAIKDALKAAQEKQAAKASRAARAAQIANRQDPRPQILAPGPNAPWLPQMKMLNDILSEVTAARPPVRDVDGDLTQLRMTRLPQMHAFSSVEANAETENAEHTRLPPPEQWALAKENEMEAAEMIETHIDHYVEEKDGSRCSVHMPTQFVKHYMRRHDNALPTVVTFATAPLVLADGALLMPDGLDRERGIIFAIQAELRAVVPKREDCTAEAVQAAMEFLCNEWLCDVATDYANKCVIIAVALTIIERSLLPKRPIFLVTAGKAGGGKTTTLQMLIMAVLGTEPAASAWSNNEDERRKTLMAYFLYGVSYILWDNIVRNTQIACPHVEKSCTSAFYSDRKLGVSEAVCTAASVVHLFTGNNIGPRGDLAARSLHVRLEVDRVDPENRPFKHPHPMEWTRDHRAKILQALYTVLLGNPQLKTPQNNVGKTRFRMWWRLVGSALEHGAKLAGHDLDFGTLFTKQKEDDEESASLANVLEILLKYWPVKCVAADVAGMINMPSPDEDEKTLREFFFPHAPPNQVFSSKKVARLLKGHVDEPVTSGKRSLVLRRKLNRDTEVFEYCVDIIAQEQS